MRCPRCAGCLYHASDETFCLNCGWRDNVPLPESYLSARQMGTSACAICGAPRCKRSTLCRSCSIVEGFAKARDLA